jgi:hypothetical protein
VSNGKQAEKTEHQGWSQAGVLGVGVVIAAASLLVDPILVRYVWPRITELVSIQVSVSLGMLKLSGLTFTPIFSIVLPLVLWGLFLTPWRHLGDSHLWRECFDCLARTVTFLFLIFAVAVLGEALAVMIETIVPEIGDLSVAARVSIIVKAPLSDTPGEMTIRCIGLIGMLTIAGGYVRRIVLKPVGRYMAEVWPQRRPDRKDDSGVEGTPVRLRADRRPKP